MTHSYRLALYQLLCNQQDGRVRLHAVLRFHTLRYNSSTCGSTPSSFQCMTCVPVFSMTVECQYDCIRMTSMRAVPWGKWQRLLAGQQTLNQNGTVLERCKAGTATSLLQKNHTGTGKKRERERKKEKERGRGREREAHTHKHTQHPTLFPPGVKSRGAGRLVSTTLHQRLPGGGAGSPTST